MYEPRMPRWTTMDTVSMIVVPLIALTAPLTLSLNPTLNPILNLTLNLTLTLTYSYLLPGGY